jgi:mannose-6-phosphate isomerase class I
MSYLKRLGLRSRNYDTQPYVAVSGHDRECWCGWPAISGELRRAIAERRGTDKARFVVAIETYTGVFDEEIIPALRSGLEPVRFVDTVEEVFRSPAEIDALVAPDLGDDDPIFGRLTRLELSDFLDSEKVARLRSEIDLARGLVVVYGPGALLCGDADLVVYADMARWEGQLRQRNDRVSNLGVRNAGLKASLQYKRSFFVDWRVCDKHKRATFGRWDYLLDTCKLGEPKLITARALQAGLAEAARRPFRVVPFFDPGVWGGQWMREVCGLSGDAPNYAWCFDCVPEENSLLLAFGDVRVEIPAINLVFFHPDELLGEPVHGRFGAEFPIRFDFLDTMGGQNLSFQVHPLVDYAREHFGLSYTQDESYYILDAEPGAVVYLGLRDDVDPVAMLSDLETAQSDPARPFPDGDHVARFPAKKHDHFLIPAGTCHCSGRNSMVLEISHTPYIFTFKMWDWARLDLNGLPRPINLERGRRNILWSRTESWCRDRLVNAFESVPSGEGWREERTGLYRSEALETRRHWFTGKVPHDTKGQSVHVLNLVQGSEAIVESPTGAFAPFVVHYAETFIVPAAVGPYTIRPHGEAEGTECATMKAFVRVNP